MRIQAQIRDALVVVIQGVADTGNVYNRNKYSSDWNRFLDLFSITVAGKKQIRGWYLGIPTLLGGPNSDTWDSHWENYTFPIRAILSYSDTDDSETQFEDMIFAVHDALQEQGVLGLGPLQKSASEDQVIPGGAVEIIVPTVELRQFGSVLCHYCEMFLTIGVKSNTAWIP